MSGKNIRIIFITHYTELYGANKSLLNLIEGIATFQIHDVVVILPTKGKLQFELEKKNIKHHIIPFVNEIYQEGQRVNVVKKIAKTFYNWFIAFRYARLLKSNKQTIIHTNTSATFIGAYFSFLLRVPHIWHVREFGYDDYKFRYNFGEKYFNFWLNKANVVIAISKAIYNKRVKDCKARIKEIIYNGVIFSKDLYRHINNKTNKPQNNTITFGIIGVISEEKGQEEAIDAFIILQKKFQNIMLIVAGEGNEQYVNGLKIKVAENNLQQQIIFAGFINDTTNFYGAIDSLLMCSKNEALGRVTIEAMSKGIPVIGFNNAGTSEIIKNNYNGFLYESGANELSKIMSRIIENKDILPNIINNAFETVKQNFTIEKYAEATYNIYNSVAFLLSRNSKAKI